MASKRNLNGRLYQIVEELVSRGVTLGQARREFEKQYIVSALRNHDGSVTQSARSIGVHRNTLRNKLCSLQIAPEDYLPPRRRSARKRS